MIQILRVTTRSTRSAESQSDEARAEAGAEVAVRTGKRARREIEAEARVRVKVEAEAGAQRRAINIPERLRKEQGTTLLADRVDLLLHHHLPVHQHQKKLSQLLLLLLPLMDTHTVIDVTDHAPDHDHDLLILDEEPLVHLLPKDVDTSKKKKKTTRTYLPLDPFSDTFLSHSSFIHTTFSSLSLSLSFCDHLAATGLYSAQ